MAIVLKKKPVHLCIAFPAYTGQVYASTMMAVVGDVVQLSQRGVMVSTILKTGNADIADCRALIVAEFLANPEFTHLMMIDSDVTWVPGAIPRLLSHDVDFVAGLYPKRSDPITFDFRSEHDKGAEISVTLDDKGLMEVWGVPAGFMMMKRGMLEKMRDHYSGLAFDVDSRVSPCGKAWDLFDAYRVGGAKLGEDYGFCQRWRDIGGRVLVDPAITMGHMGYKLFTGTLGHVTEPEEEQEAA